MHDWKLDVAFQGPARLPGFERSRVIREGHFEEVDLVLFMLKKCFLIFLQRKSRVSDLKWSECG